MTDYYKLYKTRSKKAVDKIKQLESEKTELAFELANARVKLVDMESSLNSARENISLAEERLYDQQCDNIRLSGAVGALERVAVTALRADK